MMQHQRLVVLFLALIFLGLVLAEKKQKGSKTGKTGTDSSSSKSKTGTEKSKVGTEKSKVGTSKSKTGTEKSKTGTSKSKTGTEKSTTGSEKGKTGSKKGKTGSDKKGKTGGDKKGKTGTDPQSKNGTDTTGTGKKGKPDAGGFFGSVKVPDSCLRRGKEFASSLKPDLNGTPRQWLAATCPGVFRSEGGAKKKVDGQEVDGSPFERCVWSISHGEDCHRCAVGISKIPSIESEGSASKEFLLNACRLRYPYYLKTWTETTGYMQARFVQWIKGEGKGKENNSLATAFAFVNKYCPGVFPQPKIVPDESHHDVCVWAARLGATCYAKMSGAPVMTNLETMVEKMCADGQA